MSFADACPPDLKQAQGVLLDLVAKLHIQSLSSKNTWGTFVFRTNNRTEQLSAKTVDYQNSSTSRAVGLPESRLFGELA